MGPDGRYVVQWADHGKREQRSWPNTKSGKAEAKAFFDAFTAARATPTGPITTAALWEAYQVEEFPHLRANTRRLYAEAWRHWVTFFGPDTPADALAMADCGAFRRALEERGWSVTTVRHTVRCVRGVYNWAERTERIAVNRWHRFQFKTQTGQKPKPRGEYRQGEFVAIWREFDPTEATQWRAWAITGLLGIYGNRQHAILALEWDWDCGVEIVIPASVEKTGEEAYLPIFPLTRHILDVCRSWAAREGYTGPMVFYPALNAGGLPSQSRHYTIQSYWAALMRAEKRAGITHQTGRAGHGFRRGLVGDLADATGDVGLALQAIGDSLAMAPRYRVRRDDRIRNLLSDRLAQMVLEPATEPATSTASNPSDES
jgi:integrase